jgi:glycosyltransferase involved in cell wall biosynthesis
MNEHSDTTQTVWILNQYAQMPSGMGGNTRHFSLSKYLKPHGWQSVLLAASTELNTGVQKLERGEEKRLEMADDVMFLWLKAPAFSGNGLGRMINMLGYTWQVLRKKNTSVLPKPNVIIGSSPHPFAAWAGYRLAKRYGVPYIYEVRDLWPQSIIDLGKMSARHPLSLVFYWIERICANASARILSVAPLMRDYFVARDVAAEKITWLPNGIDLRLFQAPNAKTDNDIFTYMYFGAHGYGNALDNVLYAMKLLEAREDAGEIRLRLIGSGPLKPELIKLSESLGLKRVSFEDSIPKNEVPALAAQADAFLFNVMDAGVISRYGISPNKLYDFFAAGRPIIYASSAMNNPVAEAEAGLSIAAGNPEALAEAMLKLANLPLADRQAMGRRGRAYVEANHSFNALAAKLADILTSVVGSFQARGK